MFKPFILPPGAGDVLNVVGEHIRVLADGASSAGACFAFETATAPGKGPPLHRHDREDEFFFVLEGTLEFRIDGRATVVGAGGFVAAPRGSEHAFRNVGDATSRMVVVCAPAGLDAAFREVDRLHRAGRASPDSVAAAFREHGLEIVGPPPGG